MRAKQVSHLGGLIACLILTASCGAPIITETTASFIEQPVETTTTKIQETIVERDTVPVQEEPKSTVVGMTTTTSSTLEYSLAWVEYQALESLFGDTSLKSIKALTNYMLNNPNDPSTSMGALCWAFHELYRTSMMDQMRGQLDDYLIPYLMENHGVSNEQIGSPGPEATEAFLELVSGESGTTGITDAKTDGQTILPGTNEGIEPAGSTEEAHNNSEEDSWEAIRLWHEFAGDGKEWPKAIKTVASPEMAAAFQAGDGLSSDVQVYADALIVFAKERVGMEFDPSAESDDLYFGEPNFPGLASFMQAAKHHQDCKRAIIDDSIGTRDSPPTSTTTIPPASSTTTTHPSSG